MISTMHFPSSRIKKLNAVPKYARELNKIEEDLNSVLSRDADLHNEEKRLPDRDKKLPGRFKEWQMPEQLQGYIKAKRNGLL